MNLPINLFYALQFPYFSHILTPVSLKYILVFTFLGCIESLLTVCAVDALSEGTPSDLNSDLRAVGVANLVSACVGGLPMISEIVRSKANLDYGATSAKANFFHGLFMLMAVIFIPTLINLIPVSALAALLIFVGLKLASTKQFVHAYKVGRDQLAILTTTFVVTLATDLLLGVVMGMLLKIIFHLKRGNSFKSLIAPVITVEKQKEGTVVKIEGALTFLSYLKVKKTIEKLAIDNKKLTLSFYDVIYIDHTVMSKIQTLRHHFQNLEITIQDNPQLIQFYNHPLSTRGK